MFPNIFYMIFMCSMVLSSCLRDRKVAHQLTGEGQDSRVEAAPPSQGQVKRKRSSLLKNSLAKILALDPKGMCLELGRLPCADVVHKVSLGGMDAYGNAQYRYPEHAAATSAMSLDRLVLSACSQRAGLDLLNPARAVIFKDVELSVDGRLMKTEAVAQAIQTLYQRAFLRNPTEGEVQSLLDFYEAVYAEQSIGAARNWMVLSCYSVLTSLEAGFY